ncbi:hypothetical protein TNIN_244151 [Trichonephila inaurata madagascariensis]|uniref:Uncharacterized protein n=1 Tax=Trichonephila inaurata madagascariensis TaxID=2747483 RepID=A0A8X6MHY3_9ARAC|nr:hypothetical protein TNIN_244151 [Trichonephila inaurata madagascariensis]
MTNGDSPKTIYPRYFCPGIPRINIPGGADETRIFLLTQEDGLGANLSCLIGMREGEELYSSMHGTYYTFCEPSSRPCIYSVQTTYRRQLMYEPNRRCQPSSFGRPCVFLALFRCPLLPLYAAAWTQYARHQLRSDLRSEVCIRVTKMKRPMNALLSD